MIMIPMILVHEISLIIIIHEQNQSLSPGLHAEASMTLQQTLRSVAAKEVMTLVYAAIAMWRDARVTLRCHKVS